MDICKRSVPFSSLSFSLIVMKTSTYEMKYLMMILAKSGRALLHLSSHKVHRYILATFHYMNIFFQNFDCSSKDTFQNPYLLLGDKSEFGCLLYNPKGIYCNIIDFNPKYIICYIIDIVIGIVIQIFQFFILFYLQRSNKLKPQCDQI